MSAGDDFSPSQLSSGGTLASEAPLTGEGFAGTRRPDTGFRRALVCSDWARSLPEELPETEDENGSRCDAPVVSFLICLEDVFYEGSINVADLDQRIEWTPTTLQRMMKVMLTSSSSFGQYETPDVMGLNNANTATGISQVDATGTLGGMKSKNYKSQKGKVTGASLTDFVVISKVNEGEVGGQLKVS
eukprot:GHVN01083558.1.p1 GENE.GHVN01083558.1~~GHVN01083558.1.p1  ORF type:complete len:188 (+),score=36.73 GHVN01083558.1:479-1042(+)